ncbi:rhamnan synthesis F family protein [Bradyrhizobium barranii subsp. apii]|uniref:Rhamnan synthesis F family protein n=1 Tax=Bradyrhizobium barranii subsp. apii TaxID=2819348 RepID=A0A8T5VHM3_9BRAD|nr:rhamnan synthesis F family protein [Bradyrhizobium barranii]UPT90398.1 rhamnan synthesis F family protein [Bradyrhizobium barranii subsp. apii]
MSGHEGAVWESYFSPKAEMRLVSLIERKNRALHRANQMLNPSINAIQFRQGNARHSNSVYCVLAVYQPETFPPDIVALVEELNRQKINVIFAVNATPRDIEEKLPNECHTFIRRNNHGYDFGAYKTGVEFALTLSPKRLIVLNDSVHFFEGENLSKYISRLSKDGHPFIGATESHEIRYHIQSYCYSFNEDVLTSAAFKNFWSSYVPMNERRYTVLNGEVALTSAISMAGFHPRALFRVGDLRDHLLSVDAPELIAASDLLPSSTRETRKNRIVGWLANEHDKYNFMRGIRKQQAVEEICRTVYDGNQVGLGALVFAKYLGMPFIKKNLAKYRYFSPPDIFAGMNAACLVEGNPDEHLINLFKQQESHSPTKWEKFNQRHMFR